VLNSRINAHAQWDAWFLLNMRIKERDQSYTYSGRQKYSARSAKVAHLLRAITTVPDKIERSSFFYLKDLGGLYIYS
jgi:hypothetical protein